jgi:hypothetical protein
MGALLYFFEMCRKFGLVPCTKFTSPALYRPIFSVTRDATGTCLGITRASIKLNFAHQFLHVNSAELITANSCQHAVFIGRAININYCQLRSINFVVIVTPFPIAFFLRPLSTLA